MQNSRCSFFWMAQVLMLSFLFPALQVRADDSMSHRQVVYFCNAMLHWNKKDPEPNRRAANAEHFFQKMSSYKRRQLLQSNLKETPVGSGAYKSVAYVLAYYNVDVFRNARRMLIVREVPKGYSDVPSIAENVYLRLEEIYRRHQDANLLLLLLSDESDGAGATTVRFVRLRLLTDYPHIVLRAAAQDSGALKLLAADLAHEGDKRALATIERITRSKDAVVRKSAQFCANQIQLAQKS